MIKEENYKATKEVEICDVCGCEVGELQLIGKKDGHHFCASCYTIGWAVKELKHGQEYLQDDYYKKGAYRFEHEKLIAVLLSEAKKQIKNGKFSE